MYTRCNLCGSEKIVPHVGVHDDSTGWGYSAKEHYVSVATNPTALVFTGNVSARLTASVCGVCGYTVLFAEGASELYEAYLKATQEQAE